MDKMLKEIIKELDELMEKMDTETINNLKDLQDDFQKMKRDKVTINLNLDHGKLKIEAHGNRNSILIALALLEDKILKQTTTPSVYFDLLKEIVRSDEVNSDE